MDEATLIATLARLAMQYDTLTRVLERSAGSSTVICLDVEHQTTNVNADQIFNQVLAMLPKARGGPGRAPRV